MTSTVIPFPARTPAVPDYDAVLTDIPDSVLIRVAMLRQHNSYLHALQTQDTAAQVRSDEKMQLLIRLMELFIAEQSPPKDSARA